MPQKADMTSNPQVYDLVTGEYRAPKPGEKEYVEDHIATVERQHADPKAAAKSGEFVAVNPPFVPAPGTLSDRQREGRPGAVAEAVPDADGGTFAGTSGGARGTHRKD